MRLKHTWMAVAISATFIVGCADQTTSVKNNPQTPDAETRVTGDDVLNETGEAIDVASQFAAQTKDEYLEALRAKLSQMDEKMEGLQAKANQLAGDAKQKFQEQWEDTKECREKLKEKIQAISESSGDAWVELRKGATDAWDDLQQAFGRAAAQFRDEDESKVDTSS